MRGKKGMHIRSQEWYKVCCSSCFVLSASKKSAINISLKKKNEEFQSPDSGRWIYKSSIRSKKHESIKWKNSNSPYCERIASNFRTQNPCHKRKLFKQTNKSKIMMVWNWRRRQLQEADGFRCWFLYETNLFILDMLATFAPRRKLHRITTSVLKSSVLVFPHTKGLFYIFQQNQ